MPAKKTARPAKGKKAGVDATHDSSELPTGNAEIALPTDVQLINPLDESKTRISIEYARTIMAIGVVAFIVLLVRADVEVLTKIFLSTLVFMGSLLTALLGLKR